LYGFPEAEVPWNGRNASEIAWMHRLLFFGGKPGAIDVEFGEWPGQSAWQTSTLSLD
jgi:hypothetical protein